MKALPVCAAALTWAAASWTLSAQPYDIYLFDTTAEGPWSNRRNTTLVVPKVPNGSVTLNGEASSQEYGGFAGVTVTPGENAWILDFPGDRTWDGPEDSSFTFWLAHDDDNLYVGVHVKDDVVNTDDPNNAFWRDDAIEIIIDALNDRFDVNTDASEDPYGGHCYVNYQGRFSAWNEETGEIGTRTWSTAVDWEYGENGDVFGSGKEVPDGWQLEVRFRKRLFEDPDAGNKLENGYLMGFNIGVDDDDRRGTGTNGDNSREQDLEIQYFWANRQRRFGLTQEVLDFLTPEDLQSKFYLIDYPLVIDSTGRLTHGGTGEIFFGFDDAPSDGPEILWVTDNADAPLNADVPLVGLLEAKGYDVTYFTSNGSTPDDLRAAAEGKDLVILSESIGSTAVVDPAGDVTGVFSLKETDVPIISFEPFMYDNADWTLKLEDGSNDFINLGNTGRSELPDFEIQDARDSLYIRDADHPIAGDFPAGALQVYKLAYSLNFGIPSDDADVVASVQPDGSYPTIFVYEEGDSLVDGSIAPNKRIGFFLGQAANPSANNPLAYEDLTDAAKELLFNTIAFAIGGEPPPPPGDSTISIARSGNTLTVTFEGGTLQSANAVTGPWTDETGATSPFQIQPDAAAKFYRIRQ